ncbi:MAG: SDR family oxidoreductase [Gammaproteobacteria bacterium]|nr:SDR family oxidoreductase [Gammaproteobacteria bacterium]
MNLSGKTAIITGATSGIGKATAKALHHAGVRVVVTGRNEGRVLTVAKELDGASYLVGDIADAEVPKKLIERALTDYGSCEIVINNAGIIHNGPIEKIDIDKVCEMVRINVEAAFRMAYTAVKHFVSMDRGHLINISSVLGTKVRVYTGAYSGTKYAIEALSEALRIELARTPVQVTCIQPGLVMTELHREFPVHPKEPMKIDRPLVPQDIAEAVMFALTRPEHVTIPTLMVLPKDHKT